METGQRAQLRERVLQRPRADGHDHPGLLGDGDEVDGQDDAVALAVPPQERLGAHHPAVGEAHDRLVEELELVALDGLAQRGLEVEPGGDPLLQLVAEQLDAGAAEVLGPVHRGVGVAQQLLGRRAEVPPMAIPMLVVA